MQGLLGEIRQSPRIRLIASYVLALMCGFTPRTGHGASLEVYGGLPTVENVAVSPDGGRIAYVRTEHSTRVVFVATVADQKLVRYARFGEEKLRNVEWADNDNVLITTSLTTSLYGFRAEAFLVSVYNVAKNEIRSLPGQVPGIDEHFSNVVVGHVMVRHVDGHTLVFVPAVEANEGLALIRCDLTTGLNRLTRGGTPDTSWLVDAKGQLAGQQNYDRQTQRWSISVFRAGSLHDGASGQAGLDVPKMLGFGSATDNLLVAVTEAGGTSWKSLSLIDGKFSGIAEKETFRSPILEPFTGRLIGGMDFEDTWKYRFFDTGIEEHWKAILKAFDGAQVTFVSASSDFSKIVVLVEGGKIGYRYELIDLVNPGVVTIGKVYAGIDDPLEVRRITYTAADGLEITAYLTLPKGREAHKLPLIVLPHGGPESHDTRSFDWWSQALADQGYAVLRPNYRGSNVTERLLEAGYGQWGRKMQTDLSDGVRYLSKEGIVDPARVCIVGASYGGYAALAGVTLDPGIYRCAISVAGLSDLGGMLHWEGSGGLDSRFVTRYWGRFWGVSGSADPLLDQLSPVKHVNAVNVPVLLIHGRDDTVVPFEQSQMMFDAMKGSKKAVELVALRKEDHWLSRGETRLQMLETSVAFLRTHNPPD
jgi:dipeptidyl aminopeptidase/acylaminoacyl peptidase